MSAWGAVLHQMRWDLVRMRWWIAATVAAMTVSVLCFMFDYTGAVGWIIGLVQWLLMVVMGITLVQADSPLHRGAFYRGRPLPWWSVPVAKLLTLMLVLGGASLVLSIGPLLQFDESLRERAMHLWSVVLAVAALVALGVAWGAIATSIANFLAIAITTAVLTQAMSMMLSNFGWPGSEMFAPIAIVLTLTLAFDLYRRAWRVSRAVFAFVGATLVGGALQAPAPRARGISPRESLRDSIRVEIDSITMEQPHVARVAFHVDVSARETLLRFDGNGLYASRGSSMMGFAKVGVGSRVTVRVKPDSVLHLSFRRPEAGNSAELTPRTVSSSSSSSGADIRDFAANTVDREGKRRVSAVAVLAMIDSVLEPNTVFNFDGSVLALHATREVALSASKESRVKAQRIEWRIVKSPDPQETRAGRSPSGSEEPPVWQVERRSLSSTDVITDSDVYYGPRYALRVFDADSSAPSTEWFANAQTTRSTTIVPGLMVRSREWPLTRWPLSTVPNDSVVVYRLDPAGQFGFRARYAIPGDRRALP